VGIVPPSTQAQAQATSASPARGEGKGGKEGKSKKKKGKKRGKGKLDTREGESVANEDFDDELGASNVDPSLAVSGGGEPSLKPSSLSLKSFITLDSRYLNERYELTKQFGADVIAEENEEKAAARRGRGGRMNSNGNRREVIRGKQFRLVTVDDDWKKPPTKVLDGLGMNMCTRSGEPGHEVEETYFEFEYSMGYRSIQQSYDLIVQSYDPQLISQHHYWNPFHVDTMLQLSDVLQYSGRMDDASNLTKKALFVLESALHPSFSFDSGCCRLKYSACSGNRSMFRALNNSMRNAGRKGCFKTAFTIATFIFSLDPADDPVGVTLCIDYYGVMARQYEMLLKLTEWSGKSRGLAFSSMPNILFTRALCLFKVEGGKASAESLSALRMAILTYPSMTVKLVEALQLMERDDDDGGEAARGATRWVDLLSMLSGRIMTTHDSASELVDRIASVYVQRHLDLWKADGVSDFLKLGLSTAIVSLNSNSEESRVAQTLYSDSIAGDLSWSSPPFNLEFGKIPPYREVNPGDYVDAVPRLP
jgi:hypothetical protein